MGAWRSPRLSAEVGPTEHHRGRHDRGTPRGHDTGTHVRLTRITRSPQPGSTASATESGDEFLDSGCLVLCGRLFGLDGFDEIGPQSHAVRGLEGGELGAPAGDVEPLA